MLVWSGLGSADMIAGLTAGWGADFYTPPFTKIPRPGEDPEADEMRELLMGDQSRYTRVDDRLPQWHPDRES